MNHLFSIARIGVEKARLMAADSDDSRVHDFEELIVGLSGSLEHTVNFRPSVVNAPLVAFVAKGQPHRFITKEVNGEFDMWMLRFKSEFVAETVFQLYRNFLQKAGLSLQSGTCFNRLGTVCSLIDEEMRSSSPDLSVVRHLLSALFIMIESEKKKVAPGEHDALAIQNETFVSFLQILEDNFRRPLSVDFYAEKLFMSSRNLNLISQKIMNQSVSELIETRKLTEAKHLLAHTSKSVSEIGFELGYNEKSYFSKVFKKKAGQTPSEFREEITALLDGTS
ncbi:MAG: AraC family transcriptional regulator [Bacteroidales bacterium]|nr:AraC family transcriptional regulator [Bacteroidales bacterium]